ncbi:hypothetical protein CBR_g32523 [Chara braunii]|uniref:Integrase catalytic domain-containing protein n=1 Tax=Chara braunii TaxID=69332 RepID=A0A388LGT4_CHABU|nr:hypothetical protein CBR_g32523 [Chara braunii]|eukprot:GBG81534.1 hypothetical protein CBR_g32523 [Chara braunii]
MSDEEDIREDDRRILRSGRHPIAHVSLGPEGDRILFRRLRERQQQQRRAREAETSRTLVSEAGATTAMATTAMVTSAQQTSQVSSSGVVGSTVAQTVSQSTGVMASQAAVLTPEDVAIQQEALQEAQLQRALGERKTKMEKMIRRRARMQRRGADIEELETMDLMHMDDDVKVVRRALLGVIEMQEHQTTILQDIQQSLAVLAGRAKAAPSPAGPGAWPVPYPPFSVPPVTGVSLYVAPSSVAIVSLGMPLSGGVTAGTSLQVPVQTVFTQTPLQVAVTTQAAVSQPVQPQGTQPQQLAQQPLSPGPQPGVVQGPGQTQWVPKTAIDAPKPFTGDKRGEDLDTWLRAVPVYVRCKLTLPHEEVLVAASYLEVSAARWLSGLVQLQGYGHDFRAWAASLKSEDFLKMVEERWHDPQEAQRATDAILTLHTRQFKSVREATDAVECLICVPGVSYDPQVLLTSYLRCFSQPLRNQLAKEANINMHNFPTFSKVALDIEAKIGHGQAPTTDGRKKTLPPNWQAKGRIMFVDNDGSTIEFDGNFQEGVGSEAGSVEASEGGVVVAVAQKGKATDRRRGGSRSRSQVDPNAPPWEKAGLAEDVWRDRYSRQAYIRCGQYGHNQFKCRNKKVTEKIPPTMGQAVGSSHPVGSNVVSSSRSAPGNMSDQRVRGDFRHLKHALTQYEVLKLPDPDKPFIVTTDASQYGIGVVLALQEWPKLRPVEYMSKKMSSHKLANSTYEKDLYAVYKALTHWRHYLLGRFFIFRTDHQTLRWMRTRPVLSDALKRWIEVIEQYDFDPQYLKGEYNKVVDALSCRPDFSGALITEFNLTDDVTRSLVDAYREDQFMSETIRRLEAKDKKTSAEFELVNGLLFLEKAGNKRLCVPNRESLRSLFLGECHDATGHFGYKKTAANLLQRFWWPTMMRDAQLYVETCQVCQRDKPCTQAPLGLLKPLPIPERLGESLSMDFMDTLITSKSGMRHIFVIVDRFKANGQAEQLNRVVQHLLRHYIKPNQVDWDEKLAVIASLYNNAVHSATGVSPNSLLQTFKPRLPLDFLLPENESTAAPGTSEFAYRYEQKMQQAVEQMQKAQAAMIESENRHRRPSTFQVGDRVWVKSSELGQEYEISRKLIPQCFGPWEVLDIVGTDPDGPSYVIRIPGHLHTYPVFHASKLAPFKETDQFPSRRSMLPPTMDGEADIDDIEDHRELPVSRPAGRGRPPKPKLQYHVRFRHHTDPKEDCCVRMLSNLLLKSIECLGIACFDGDIVLSRLAIVLVIRDDAVDFLMTIHRWRALPSSVREVLALSWCVCRKLRGVKGWMDRQMWGDVHQAHQTRDHRAHRPWLMLRAMVQTTCGVVCVKHPVRVQILPRRCKPDRRREWDMAREACWLAAACELQPFACSHGLQPTIPYTSERKRESKQRLCRLIVEGEDQRRYGLSGHRGATRMESHRSPDEGELDVGEAVNPILLIRTDERTKHHLSGLMCPLRLPVRLWMPSRTWFHLGVGFLHERSPKRQHETSAAVANNVFRDAVAANPAGVQEARKFKSHGVALAREKSRVFTQSVNDLEDAIVLEAVARERAGDVHGNGEAGFPRDG